MTNEEAGGFINLCRQAAAYAAAGTGVDVEDVTQELLAWILKTQAITSPSYPGLLGWLVRAARQYVQAESRQRYPAGWAPLSWSTAEIRDELRRAYYHLPPQLQEALESPRMPQSYREALEAAYGRRQRPRRGSSAERTVYLAVDRLQEVANYPVGSDLADVA